MISMHKMHMGQHAHGAPFQNRTHNAPGLFVGWEMIAMATRARRICSYPGCDRITTGQYCQDHAQQTAASSARAYDSRRGSAAARGYDARWHRFAKAYLAQPEHQFCALHISQKCSGVAQCVDHIRPLRGRSDPGRFALDNLQPACIACNTAKGDKIIRGTYTYGAQLAGAEKQPRANDQATTIDTSA